MWKMCLPLPPPNCNYHRNYRVSSYGVENYWGPSGWLSDFQVISFYFLNFDKITIIIIIISIRISISISISITTTTTTSQQQHAYPSCQIPLKFAYNTITKRRA